MNARIIDFAQSRELAPDDIAGLNAHLAQLIGEPFQFARVSYGDELTLHFGNLRPTRSPKLKNQLFGEYILGLRGSRWSLKAGKTPVLLMSGILSDDALQSAHSLAKEELETKPFVETGSCVVAAKTFFASPLEGFFLALTFADGSTLFVLPGGPDLTDDEPDLPPLSDWELLSPKGLLSAGPGSEWSFKAQGTP